MHTWSSLVYERRDVHVSPYGPYVRCTNAESFFFHSYCFVMGWGLGGVEMEWAGMLMFIGTWTCMLLRCMFFPSNLHARHAHNSIWDRANFDLCCSHGYMDKWAISEQDHRCGNSHLYFLPHLGSRLKSICWGHSRFVPVVRDSYRICREDSWSFLGAACLHLHRSHLQEVPLAPQGLHMLHWTSASPALRMAPCPRMHLTPGSTWEGKFTTLIWNPTL